MAAGLMGLAVLGGAPAAAGADGPGGGVECNVYICEVEVDVPGQPGAGAGDGDGSEPQGEEGADPDPWSCTYELVAPQPPAGSLDWDGHQPGEGAVYEETCHYLDSAHSVVRRVWLAEAPDAMGVDPAVLAQRAVDSMALRGPDIASPRPAGKYIVGMPTWMWVTPSANTYGPNTATASAGGVSVTATAKVSRIVWQMGDGATVTCAGPGTPYTPAAGRSESPTCGHTYTRSSTTQAGGRYPVTATSTWLIDWHVTTGSGAQAGQLTETRQSQLQIRIGEVQVLN